MASEFGLTSFFPNSFFIAMLCLHEMICTSSSTVREEQQGGESGANRPLGQPTTLLRDVYSGWSVVDFQVGERTPFAPEKEDELRACPDMVVIRRHCCSLAVVTLLRVHGGSCIVHSSL